jgi:hypothetical protein
VLVAHIELPEYEGGGKEESVDNGTDTIILRGTKATATTMLLKSTASSVKTDVRK